MVLKPKGTLFGSGSLPHSAAILLLHHRCWLEEASFPASFVFQTLHQSGK
ncbi:hypothetical protein A2U01_0059808, partial [Trifolium medium]|nr:hypothetical protein [Trifolium medium]